MVSLRGYQTLFLTLFASLALSVTASATPVVWTLSGVTLQNGVTASGSFTFDADATVPCSTHVSPCGTYSNIDITTTAGGGLSAATYLDACGTDVPSCDANGPDSTKVLLLTSNALNQGGKQGLEFFFTGIGGTPPAGLTDAGGKIDVSDSNLAVGDVEEGICNDIACDFLINGFGSTAGFVISAAPAPEPSAFALALLPLAVIFLSRRGLMGRHS